MELHRPHPLPSPPDLPGWLKRVGDGISLTRSPTAAITCPHGGLMPQAPGLSGSRRIAVTPRVWHFVKLFWETEVATDERRKRAACAAKAAAGVAKTKADASAAAAAATATGKATAAEATAVAATAATTTAATTKEAPMELGDDEDDDDITITADIVPPSRPHPPAQPWLINGIPPRGALAGLPRFRAPPAKAEGGKATRGGLEAVPVEVKKGRGAGLPRTRSPPPEAEEEEEEEVALVEHPAVEVEVPGGAPAAAGPFEVMSGTSGGLLHCQEFPASCSAECTRWGSPSASLALCTPCTDSTLMHACQATLARRRSAGIPLPPPSTPSRCGEGMTGAAADAASTSPTHPPPAGAVRA